MGTEGCGCRVPWGGCRGGDAGGKEDPLGLRQRGRAPSEEAAYPRSYSLAPETRCYHSPLHIGRRLPGSRKGLVRLCPLLSQLLPAPQAVTRTLSPPLCPCPSDSDFTQGVPACRAPQHCLGVGSHLATPSPYTPAPRRGGGAFSSITNSTTQGFSSPLPTLASDRAERCPAWEIPGLCRGWSPLGAWLGVGLQPVPHQTEAVGPGWDGASSLSKWGGSLG